LRLRIESAADVSGALEAAFADNGLLLVESDLGPAFFDLRSVTEDRYMKARLVLLALLGAVMNGALAAQYPVQLSAVDREAITAAACAAAGAKGAEHITATTTKRGSASIEATVQCQSHRSVGKLPVASHFTCHNRAGTWACAKGHDAVRVPIREKIVVTVVAHGLALGTAADVVARASKMTYPPFTEQAWPIFTGTCSVGVVASPGRDGLTRYAIDCTGGKVEMNRLCWKEGCRHFNVSGERAAP
jgi:hypothetical protein